jgi:hypothetical protein
MNQDELDKLAIQWNKTKDPKYKDLWYEKVREMANGINNPKRRSVSTRSGNKANVTGYEVVCY